jgi:flagellin
MAFSIVNNITSMQIENNLNATQLQQSNVLEQLSSGLRINKAADDSAGLAISQEMTSQVNGLNQASQNAQEGINVIQTASSALTQTSSILQQVRSLTVEAANGTNTSDDASDIQAEVNQLLAEIDRFSTTTAFNTQQLISGSLASSAMTLQIGANANETLSFTIMNAGASSLGVSGISVTSNASAEAALASIDAAIDTVSTEQANLGAMQNRLQFTISNLTSESQNASQTESNITDSNVAADTVSMTQLQILQQAGVSALSQANSAPEVVLTLLGH